MEQNKTFFTDFKKQVIEYFELRMKLARLTSYEKIAKVSAALVSAVIVVMLFLFFSVFLFISVGFYLSKLTGSYGTGFGLVALFYLIVLLLFFAVRKKYIEETISNKVIEILTENEDETGEGS